MSASDADDLVTTFEVAWRRFGEIPFAAPLPWLYAVAHNHWRNRCARRATCGAEGKPGTRIAISFGTVSRLS